MASLAFTSKLHLQPTLNLNVSKPPSTMLPMHQTAMNLFPTLTKLFSKCHYRRDTHISPSPRNHDLPHSSHHRTTFKPTLVPLLPAALHLHVFSNTFHNHYETIMKQPFQNATKTAPLKPWLPATVHSKHLVHLHHSKLPPTSLRTSQNHHSLYQN